MSYVKSIRIHYIIGSEERMVADAAAIDKLDLVVSLSTPPPQSSPGSSSEDLSTILNKLHMAKDKHIFRCKYDFDKLC